MTPNRTILIILLPLLMLASCSAADERHYFEFDASGEVLGWHGRTPIYRTEMYDFFEEMNLRDWIFFLEVDETAHTPYFTAHSRENSDSYDIYILHVNENENKIDTKDYMTLRMRRFPSFRKIAYGPYYLPEETVLNINGGKALVGVRTYYNPADYPLRIVDLATGEIVEIDDEENVLTRVWNDRFKKGVIEEPPFFKGRYWDFLLAGEKMDKLICPTGVYSPVSGEFREFPLALTCPRVDDTGTRIVGLNDETSEICMIDLETLECSVLTRRKTATYPGVSQSTRSMYRLTGETLYYSDDHFCAIDWLRFMLSREIGISTRKWYALDLATGKRRRIFQPSRWASLL